MFTLKWTFKLLTLNGIMTPSTLRSQWQKILYRIYMFSMVMLMHMMEFFLILDMMYNVKNQDDFSDNLYITLILLSSCCKSYMLLTSARSIKVMVNMLNEEPFAPMNREEREICARYEKKIDWNAKAYTYFLDVFVVLLWMTSYFTDYRRRKFKFRVWLPYDIFQQPVFTLIYCQQIVCTWYSVNVNVICDCLYSGLMIHICCQLEILAHRVNNLTKNKMYSANLCARHHNRIYKFAEIVNRKLESVSTVQLMISTGSICFNLYRMLVIELGPKFVEALTVTLCLLTQIFYYCWYGNEVKIKSLEIVDTVIDSNITVLDESSKKILVLIMRRALEPIEFTSLHFISINLESFTSLLKSSYAAFNMLQERRGE